jgi:hypothetical protein
VRPPPRRWCGPCCALAGMAARGRGGVHRPRTTWSHGRGAHPSTIPSSLPMHGIVV